MTEKSDENIIEITEENIIETSNLNSKSDEVNEENPSQENDENETIKTPQLSTLDSLAPTTNPEVDKDGIYEAALTQALNKDSVKNIALTGIYGSGKSSILQKYIEKHKYNCSYFKTKYTEFIRRTKPRYLFFLNKYNEKILSENENKFVFFQVSLASFNNIGNNDIRNIEKSVLQQIFYQVDSKFTPNSRFRKIIHLSNFKILLYELLFIMFLLSMSLLIYPQILNIPKKIFSNMTESQIPYPFAVAIFWIFILIVCLLLYKIIKFIVNRISVASFSLKKHGFEITGTGNKKESIFNKYLDEIIYFFEATKYNVIIFEDLDRFNNAEIFIKLRELNTVLNNYERINRKIVFVYAVKDDLFKDKDRTKFFDMVIPIIPFLNSSNSFEILDKKIKKLEIADLDISEEYLIDISIFIYDMRLLDNIINEFNIYRCKLNKTESNDEKLLSMMIYKNMYPSDFSNLQENKGFVYDALSNKKNLINNRLIEINKELNFYRNELKEIEHMSASDIDDLEGIFVHRLYMKLNNDLRTSSLKMTVDNKDISISDFINGNIDYDAIGRINVSYYNSYGNTRYYDFDDDLLSFVKDIPLYKERIRNYIGKEKRKYETKIELLLLEKEKLDITSYSELLDSYKPNYDDRYSSTEYDLIKYLLRNGYIDESYADYIAYFHQGNLTAEDHRYILALKNNKSLGHAYKLTNIKLIITKLGKRYFRRKEFYNVYLLDYMIQNRLNEDLHFIECFDETINSLCENSDENGLFIFSFVNHLEKTYSKNELRENISILIKIMSAKWNGCFNFLSTTMSEKKDINFVKMILIDTLKNLKISEIKQQNGDNCIVNLICSFDDFIDFSSEVDNTNEIIKELVIKFNNLNVNETSKTLEFIYKNGYCEFNYNYMENIEKLYFSNEKEFKNKNYSIIQNSDLLWLKKKVHDNITKYVSYMLKLGSNFSDENKYIIEILAYDQIPFEQKLKVLKQEAVIFDNFDEINSNLWTYMLENKKVLINWSNIEKFYAEYGYTDELAKCIYQDRVTLSDFKIDEEELALDLLKDEKVSTYYLNTDVFDEFEFDLEEIEELEISKLKMIINKDLIAFNEVSFNFLTKLHASLSPLILQKVDLDEFDFSECEFTNENIKHIFEANIEVVIKKKILNELDLSKYNPSNLKNISYFVADFCTMDDIEIELLKNIVSLVDINTSIHVIISKKDEFDYSEMIDLLDYQPYLKEFKEFHNSLKFDISDDTRQFLDYLCSLNIIHTYKTQNSKYVCRTRKLEG